MPKTKIKIKINPTDTQRTFPVPITREGLYYDEVARLLAAREERKRRNNRVDPLRYFY